MIDRVLDLGAIVVADLVLSGDNALIIGMAAAGLTPRLRARAILFGMVIAAVLRILFAFGAVHLLRLPGLLLAGGLLLLWVCWRLYREIREGAAAGQETFVEASDPGSGYQGPARTSLVRALATITLADLSMSLDNVLAVAALSRGDPFLLIFGLGVAIVLMACAATLIMKLLTRFPWISWAGLVILIWVAGGMVVRGVLDNDIGLGPMLGITRGYDFHDHHQHRPPDDAALPEAL